jgi:hypothetical protein
MVEVKVENIRVSLMSQQHVVILKDLASTRYLAIWIGRYEAEAIRLALEGEVPPRPLTHDLTLSMILSLGARIERVVISDIYNDTFYARIELVGPDGKKHSVDSRSSDGVALAVRAHCPLLVETDIMNKAAITPEESEAGETEPASDGNDLGAFDDFINSMNLDDSDKDK